jgi:hypothetical protein
MDKSSSLGMPMHPKKYPRGTSVKAWGCCDDLKFEDKFEVPVMYSTAIPGFMFAIYIT